MTKKADRTQTDTNSGLFVFGLDDNGKPRGARFSEAKDDVVKAALDMKCWVVADPVPPDFMPLGMKLPLGRLYASGRAFIPNIRRHLYDKLFAAKGTKASFSTVWERAEPPVDLPGNASSSPERGYVPPLAPGLPRSWDAIEAGHMVLMHESPEDGWWEALVLNRENEILTLRFRDYPRLPTRVRHISTVALVNPGSTPSAS
jgi:hypothetical protein